MTYINYISKNKATYSYKAIRECVEAIKTFSWSAPKRKIEFQVVATELNKLYELLFNKTDCILFAPDDYNSELIDFKRAAYNYKNYTVKELSELLKRNELYVNSEISSLRNMMDRGEVNTVI